MLYTATAIDLIPSGTDFWLTGYGVRIGPKPEVDEDDPEGDCVFLGKSGIDIPAGREFFVSLGWGESFSVSLEPPTGMVCVKITRDDLINDNF